MGGKVLDLPEIVGYCEALARGEAKGRAEGEEERKKLHSEKNELQSEVDFLKSLLEKNGIKVW